MNRLFRPSILLPAWVALTLGALALVLGPSWQGVPANRAVPMPVPAGDQEVVWLNAATSAVGWERFVASIHLLQESSDLDLQVVDDSNAFPSQTTAVPELAVTVRGRRERLWFRWYKLTGELDSSQWVRALARRDPPPLAIIGGGSSDRARDLARELNDARGRLAAPPLLLITQATADHVEVEQGPEALMHIYAGRSFRFCFTNQQMATAVIDFIWSQTDLRPDSEPVYLVRWQDDPYSKDLFNCFRTVLTGEGYSDSLRRLHLAQLAARYWGSLARFTAMGGLPPGMVWLGLHHGDLNLTGPAFWSASIPYSVGAYNEPNRWEAEAAEKLIDEFDRRPEQRQPLVIVPAMPQPARRFLRGLMRNAPFGAGQFVIATGDAVDFNTVYRDRRLAWPIQDVPFPLVFFCHRNPVDPAAFEPDSTSEPNARPLPTGRTATGTQDLLLYRDIVATVTTAAFAKERLAANADVLRDQLLTLQTKDGRARFDGDGNPISGSGEYVVRVQPERTNGRIWPRAILQVWNRATDLNGARSWVRVSVAGQTELLMDYTER